jgi:hypothetical protein
MVNSAHIENLKKFVLFCARELNMDVPKIKFVGASQDKHLTFAHTIGKDITVRITNRHPGDVMRSIAHEMYHAKLNNKQSSQSEEDKANATAGRIMRKYNGQYPSLFKMKPINETMSAVPVNATGPAVANFSPLLMQKPLKRKKLRTILNKGL